MITKRSAFAVLAVAALAAACAPVKPPPPPPLPPLDMPCSASSGSPVAGNDPLRSGWYPDQPGLNPSAGGQCAFGEQWSAPVDGQVYAQPVVDPGAGPNGTLVVATETNHVYGFDAVTGQQLWARNYLGPPWDPNELACQDLSPSVGTTSTPAIDAATHTAYMFSKTYDNGSPAYFAHAMDLNANGNEKPGFPRKIEGFAANVPNVPPGAGASFDAQHHLQRPGLLLMNGVVYAAFGGHCDVDPYRGWVAGVNASTGAISTLWTDEALPPAVNPSPRGGIWQSGGRLINDNGDIVLASGNGEVPPAPTPGKPLASPTLGEAAMRLRVVPGGALQAVDFFAPCNAQALNDKDLDLGTGAPLVLPDSFGTAAHPHLLLVAGKSPTLYLLDRDNLGGFQQGSAGSCPDGSGQAGDHVLSTLSAPNTFLGPWATPAEWPGDGGLIYLPYQNSFGGSGKFIAYRVTPDGNGTPQLSVAGQSNDDPYGFGSSSAIITSDGTTSGSALVWLVRLPGPDGVGAELRAYDADPSGGALTLRGRWPVGQGTKFNTPTVFRGRVYVGARDGLVHAFGVLPQGTAAQSPPPPRHATANQVPDREG
jgi:hypothetical protein